LAAEQETVAVETQAKFGRELLIPRDITPGTYIASVKVIFEDSVGLSSDLFEVEAKAIRLYPVILRGKTLPLLLGIIGVVVVSIFLIYGSRYKKPYVPRTKEEKTKLIKTEEKTKKMETELHALEAAYN